MREITVAVAQMQPKLADIETNLVHMGEFVERICLEQKTDIIVFPELITTGYECGVGFTDLAERVPGRSVNLLAARAAEFGTHIAFGMVSKEKVESILFNAAVLIGPDGEMIGEYRKAHLKGEERMAFRPGFRYLVLDADFGPVGLLVGWDLAFPEVARSLALEGAELLCVCANWEQPHTEEWRTYLLARAYENSVFVAAANRVGEEPSYSFFGDSMIVGPRGELYGSIDEEIEGYAVARIDLDQVRKCREEFQLFQCRQPATYRAIVKKY